jgi:hypothetical protein
MLSTRRRVIAEAIMVASGGGTAKECGSGGFQV